MLLSAMGRSRRSPYLSLQQLARFLYVVMVPGRDVDQRALRPSQDEVWAAVMDQMLDELGEEWGVEL